MQALGDVIEHALKSNVHFNLLRQQVYQWTQQQNYFLLGVDRLGADGTYIILVTYWDTANQKHTESFDEWSSYTNAHPISTW
jgi:hypothetical protein